MPEFAYSPLWPDCPANVRALITTRQGGCSPAPWQSFNLGEHVGDALDNVERNRAQLRTLLPAEPRWLRQVHGTCVIAADETAAAQQDADASVARRAGVVCVVMVADCLPVLLCDRAGTVVAAAHAGWRGLAAGVLEATVKAMQQSPDTLTAFLGPSIGPTAFEVGPEVRAAFMAHEAFAAEAFVAGQGDRWWCNLPLLAHQRLLACGLQASAIQGGTVCTVSDAAHFFSYRRDGQTGRMAALIWREDA